MENIFGKMAIVKRIVNLGIETLFPRFCLRCGREGVAWCGVCDESYTPRQALPSCPFCAASGSDRVCNSCKQDVYLDGLSAAAMYSDPIVRGSITRWKYHGDVEYRQAVQKWIRKGFRKTSIPQALFYVTHVPLHQKKKRARGFDQAEFIAQVVAEELGLEHISLLTRRYQTGSQAKRTSESRIIGDLDDAFEAAQVVPLNVLLCDDVFTSGSTIDAAAKCLKEAGAKLVWGCTIARG